MTIFDHAHPKIIESTFSFPEFVSARKKKQFIPSVHFCDTVNLRGLQPEWPHPFLTMFTPKIFNHLLICVNLYQHAKNQLIPSLRQSQLQSPETNWPNSYFDHAQTKNVRAIFNFCEFELSSYSGKIVDLKILQSDWLRAFWSISQE